MKQIFLSISKYFLHQIHLHVRACVRERVRACGVYYTRARVHDEK
jgi:hypothetical protein